MNNAFHQDGSCFMNVYFKNDRQFCFMVETMSSSQLTYTEYNIDFGTPPVFTVSQSDAATPVKLEPQIYNNVNLFTDRITHLKKAGYEEVFTGQELNSTVDAFIQQGNEMLGKYCLLNEIVSEIQHAAQQVGINLILAKKEGTCSIQ